MKNNFLLIAFLVVAATLSASATTYTVNNNNPSPGQYNNVAAAVSAAASGDTILIAGSPYNYNTITLTKPLTLIGSGHKPLSQSPARSFCDYIYFNNGSSGSNVIGMEVYQIIDNYTGNPGISNILISRCKISFSIYIAAWAGNWTIESNIFEASYNANNYGPNYGNIYGWDGSGQHDITIRNNIFNGFLGDFGYYYSWSSNVYIIHNIFLTSDYYLRDFDQCTYYVNDNIFYRARPKSLNGNGSYYYNNNISFQSTGSDTTFLSGTNYVNKDPMFTNFPNAGALFSYAYDFNLQPSSIGKNGASDATDVGVYGGTAIFNQRGIPTVPYIKSLQITGSNTVPANGTLNISVTGKVVR